MVKTRLKWYGHLKRIPINSIVERVNQMKNSQITSGRWIPVKTIRNIVKKDLEINELRKFQLLFQWLHNTT